MSMSPIEGLESRLNYRFRQRDLLRHALTHRSMGQQNNERLEFLGDSILGFVVSGMLYHHFPDVAEGDLSRLRARLVRGENLAEIAREFSLGEALLLGQGELKSGGFRRDSILADAMEAVIGAIYLDGGFEQCEQWLKSLFEEQIASLPPLSQLKDPKTRLQEWLQARGQPLPEYEVVKVEGEGHLQLFRVACRVKGMNLTTRGEGKSRRKAEQEAATLAIKELEKSA